MAVNSTNDIFLHPDLPSGMSCLFFRPHASNFIAYNITNTLVLLPFCILILQRWQKQRSISTASHSDSFTYHMVAVELVGVLGRTLICCGIFLDLFIVLDVGYGLWSFSWYTETFLHVLTCVERYLAVVHPVTYMNLRRKRGVRIRNVTIGCVWLLSIGLASLTGWNDRLLFVDACLLILFLIFVTFCSLSVLNVLVRPGPGEQGGDRERVDQSKKRAFYTIVAILGALLTRFCWNLLWTVSYMLEDDRNCMVQSLEIWFNLSSSLVLPLLFLQRAGMLTCCKNNPK